MEVGSGEANAVVETEADFIITIAEVRRGHVPCRVALRSVLRDRSSHPGCDQVLENGRGLDQGFEDQAHRLCDSSDEDRIVENLQADRGT